MFFSQKALLNNFQPADTAIIYQQREGKASKESKPREDEDAEQLFRRVNANYAIGSVSPDKVNAAEHFQRAYADLLDFWQKHPEKVSEDMVGVMVQICCIQTSNASEQAEKL